MEIETHLLIKLKSCDSCLFPVMYGSMAASNNNKTKISLGHIHEENISKYH